MRVYVCVSGALLHTISVARVDRTSRLNVTWDKYLGQVLGTNPVSRDVISTLVPHTEAR